MGTRQKEAMIEREGYTAVFALREQVGGRGDPYVTYEILKPWESWHDKVRGDGGSYRPGGPEKMKSLPRESFESFEKRVQAVKREYEDNN